MGNSRFSDGFLMGAVAGGALVFLLGTKKGNQVLKIIMEEGRATLGDLMDEVEEYREEMKEAQVEAETLNEETVEKKAEPVKSEDTKADKEVAPAAAKPKPSKRFFKKK